MSGLDRLGPVPVGISWWLDNGELDGINYALAYGFMQITANFPLTAAMLL